jgi:hypothetical protein
MQTESGGLATWPGAQNNYAYGSVYALHFLTLVRNDRELEVPEDNFEALQAYARSIATDWAGEHKNRLYLRAYAVYALALDGDLDAIHQIERFDDVKLPQASRYLLAAALAQNTQDKARVRMYLASAPSAPYEVVETSGSLNSDVRNKAVELLALLQMEGEEAAVAERARELLRYLEGDPGRTTQKSAFVIAALAQYMKTQESAAAQGAATIASPDGETHAAQRRRFHRGQHGREPLLCRRDDPRRTRIA